MLQTAFTVETKTSPTAGVVDRVEQTLGDMATQSSDAVALTGGTEAGVLRTPVAEAIVAAGAISVTKEHTTLDATAATMAVTLAAPTKPGLIKVITMIAAGGHTATLALTNVQGGSAATTATFGAINDTLVLIAGTNKWTVLKEAGVVLS